MKLINVKPPRTTQRFKEKYALLQYLQQFLTILCCKRKTVPSHEPRFPVHTVLAAMTGVSYLCGRRLVAALGRQQPDALMYINRKQPTLLHDLLQRIWCALHNVEQRYQTCKLNGSARINCPISVNFWASQIETVISTLS